MKYAMTQLITNLIVDQRTLWLNSIKIIIMKPTLCSLLFVMIAFNAHTQSTGLLPDQNPDYKMSQDKYTRFRDSLLINSNLTIQDTYKAYDWYAEKIENRNNRRQARRANWGFNNGWGFNNDFGFNNGWGPNNGFGFNNRWGFNNGWNSYNNFNRRNRFNPFFPGIGFRTGNWFFSF